MNAHIFSLIFLSCHVFETDARFSLLSDFKLRFSHAKISEYFSEFGVSIPNFKSCITLCKGKLSNFVSAANKLITDVYDNFKGAIYDSNDFLAHFALNGSLWYNWPFKGIHSNCSKLKTMVFDLQIANNLYGQHLAKQVVNEFLKPHLTNDDPKKPLVMSFHGPTGCGKSLLSQIIAENLFEDGYRSKFVHIYHGSLDFSYKNRKESYKKKLLYEIPLFVHNCERSLFIFEEMDKMVPGVIDVLVPYLKLNENSLIDFRKTTFIFISKTGDDKITEMMYDAWFDGVPREDLTLDDFLFHLKDAAYNAPSGLQHSQFVSMNVIDVFVPFLPLEKEHVKECIIRELKLRELPHQKNIVEEVANQIHYAPPEFETFSISGCKRVSHKVDIFYDSS